MCAEYYKNIEEVWKDIPGWENLYQASNWGYIKSLILYKGKPSRILQTWCYGNYGHLEVTLCKNKTKTRHKVHRLILETFIGSCPSGMECRHLDGNPKNNKLSNLIWGTPKENQSDRILHGTDNRGSKQGSSKMKDKQIKEIRKLAKEGKFTQQQIANMFNICQPMVSMIKNKKRWQYLDE